MSSGRSNYRLVPVGDFLREDVETVDPRQSPEEVFELWSIPAHDKGTPEVVVGSQVGSHKKLVKPGDVLLSKIVPHIQRSRVVGRSEECRRIIASTEWIVFSGEQANPQFLREVLTSELFHRKFMETITGVGGSLARANPKAVSKIKIPLPPLAEQRKIAEILRTWDEAIEIAEAEHESLVKQLNGLVQSLALRIPEGKAPNGWVDRQIGDLVVEVDRRVEWDDDMTYKLVSCARRSGGIFHREDKLGSEIAVKKMQEIRSGDFILSRMQVLHGGWAMVEPDFAGHHVSDMYMILEPRTDRLYMSYFDWISRTSWMRHLAYLASYGVHIEKMTFVPKLFLKSKVRIPDSIAEQKRIAEILDGFSQKVEISSALLELLRNQKRGLMQKLLTGEVRVAA